MEEFIWQALNFIALIVLILTIGCKVSPRCQYYTNVWVIYIGLLHMGCVLSIYGLFHKTYETSRFSKKLLDPIGKLLNVQYQVEGQRLVDKNRAYIVISNHQHALDMVTHMQVWDMFDKIASIAKHELKYAGPFGLAAILGGTVFVKRSKHEKAMAALNEAVKKAKDTGTSLAIFPEGTRHLASSDGECMLPFKKGAFHMAIDGGLPILPIVISEYDFINRKEKTFGCAGNRKVTLTIMDPIETSELTKDDVNDLVESTRSEMIKIFKSQKEQKLVKEQNQHIKSE